MKFDSEKISEYLIRYYNINDNTPFEIKEVDATELLCHARLDLGAKLYFIHSYITNTNRTLAKNLYNNHIAAFQDGIIAEHGNRTKNSFEKYHEALIGLIKDFRKDNFDSELQYIPVDKNMCLLDGAHRVACSVYFHKKVKIIQFPTIQAYTYDRHFFSAHGLEKGYLDLMEYTVFTYNPSIFKKYASDSQAREMLDIDTKEMNQAIYVSSKERFRCKSIRFIRNRYTRMVLLIKKILRMPI